MTKIRRQVFFPAIVMHIWLQSTTLGVISDYVRTIFVPQSSFCVFYILEIKGFKILRETLDLM